MAKLDDILKGKGRTFLPTLHLQQIGLFLWRSGIQVYPVKDTSENMILKFLDNYWEEHRTDLYLQDIWERGATTGEVLFFLRPLHGTYRFFYYDATQFEPYYDENLELESVLITNKCRTAEGDRKLFYRVSKTWIETWNDSSKRTKKTRNVYGFLPCVLVQNKPSLNNGRGRTEFELLQSPIEKYDDFGTDVFGNLGLFGGPIFYSTRSVDELLEAGLVNEAHSIAAESGYRQEGVNRSEIEVRTRRVLGGLEAGEEIGFVSPPAIESSSISYMNRYQESLITALGGTPRSNTFSGALGFYNASGTASRKATTYITRGICSVYELLLKMASFDGLIDLPGESTRVAWRYTGSVFPESAGGVLNRSIVSRNLLRLGVNLEDAVRYVLPEKTDDEIDSLLDGGFAYELLDAVSSIIGKIEDGAVRSKMTEYIKRELDNESRKRKSGSFRESEGGSGASGTTSSAESSNRNGVGREPEGTTESGDFSPVF